MSGAAFVDLAPRSDVARWPSPAVALEAEADSFEIILDLSRLLSRVLRAAPTGIDRVEMAYAQRLGRRHKGPLSFAAVHPSGAYGRLPADAVRRFIDDTARRWLEGDEAPGRSASAWRALSDLIALMPQPAARGPRAEGARRIYLQISPHHLDRPALVRRILRVERARLVCMAHDLIPIEHPRYARPGGAALHARRMRTLADLAHGVVAVSHATRASLERFLGDMIRPLDLIAAPLGVPPAVGRTAPAAEPYFVMLGTIEPRKNLSLALDVMDELARGAAGRAAPRLHVVGARGWERPEVRRRLDRVLAAGRVVVEHNNLSDLAVSDLLAGARALIMPSFAEGFGLPVAEALAQGVPVICSDIPALREIGAGAPDYLAPGDPAAWRQAMIDYGDLEHPRRRAQLARLSTWRVPTWDAHLDTVLALARRVANDRI
jgi:glycosyltransferase involved in cell wall biosynthesis